MAFEWHPTDFILKKTEGTKEFHHKIEKMSMMTNPDNHNEELDITLEITMEKNFLDLDEPTDDVNTKFMWHKSTIIPMVNVGVDCELYVAKLLYKSQKYPYYEALDLKGQTSYTFRNNCVLFSGLKFGTTSYNHEGLDFQFVVIIYVKEGQSPYYQNVLYSAVSSSFIVDSRKTARHPKIPVLTIDALYSQFHLKYLAQEYYKKNKGEAAKTKIHRDLKGFLNYYQAQNIRSKILNPFFVGIYFKDAVRLLVNNKIVQNNTLYNFKSRNLILELSSDNKSYTLDFPFLLVPKNQEIHSLFESLLDKSIKLRCLLAQKFWIMNPKEIPSNYYEIETRNVDTDFIKSLIPLYLEYIRRNREKIEVTQIKMQNTDNEMFSDEEQGDYDNSEEDEEMDKNEIAIFTSAAPSKETASFQHRSIIDISCQDNNPIFIFNPEKASYPKEEIIIPNSMEMETEFNLDTDVTKIPLEFCE